MQQEATPKKSALRNRSFYRKASELSIVHCELSMIHKQIDNQFRLAFAFHFVMLAYLNMIAYYSAARKFLLLRTL